MTNGVTNQCVVVNTVADFSITKSNGVNSVGAGTATTYVVRVSNAGPSGVSGAVLSDPPAMGLTKTVVACSGTPGACVTPPTIAQLESGTFALPAIAAGGFYEITVTATVTAISGSVSNTATVASPVDPNVANNTATDTDSVSVTAPTIAKGFSPASIAIGTTSTITFTLSNANAIALTNAAFTDSLTNMAVNATGNAGGTCVGASGNALTAGQTMLALSGMTIPASGSCTVTVVVVSNVGGMHPNTTSAMTTNQAPPSAVSNTATLTVTAAAPTIAKAFGPATINSGGISTLTITITNPNAGPITVTGVTDTFPTTPMTGIVRATTPNAATSCAGGVVTHTAGSVSLMGGSVPAAGTCTITIDVTAAGAGNYVNTLNAGALVTNAGTNAAAASATLTVNPVANVSITKSGPATIAWGTTISYSVTVSNSGPDAANATVFTDSVPAPIGAVMASCGAAMGGAACGPVTVSGNLVTSTITTLPPGGSVTFTIQGTAPQSGTLSNVATAIVPAGITDPDDPGRTGAGNNTSNTVMTTVLAPDLRLGKSAAPAGFTVGSAGSFTLTPNNTAGTLPTAGLITVSDTLPSGLSYVPAGSGGTGWACSALAQTVTCTSMNVIAAGAAGNPITINVSVAGAAVPSITNTAQVSGGNEPPVNGGNNSALVMVAVSSMAVNTFLTDGAQTGLPGSTVLYTHVFNAGLAGTVSFSISNVPTPAVAGWTNAIFRDTNCNGMLEIGEGSTPLAGSVAVNPGDQVCLVIKSNIPATAPYNAQDVIAVTATFTQVMGPMTNYTRQDVTTVGAAGGAGLTLMKSVRNVTQGGAAGTTNTARPGDTLEYVVTYSNAASTPVMMVVISDNTPAFTNFVSASCGMPLPAALTACNVTTQPVVGAGGNVQWTLTGQLNASQSGTVVFRVVVQ
ncbi:MAG: DUF11 domain-containing protein [Betaproteobacteria bacterium]|nr:DUF11 domain-containing protein [Betaproteobacteria bacterium]